MSLIQKPKINNKTYAFIADKIKEIELTFNLGSDLSQSEKANLEAQLQALQSHILAK
jgi:hypothetical protein